MIGFSKNCNIEILSYASFFEEASYGIVDELHRFGLHDTKVLRKDFRSLFLTILLNKTLDVLSAHKGRCIFIVGKTPYGASQMDSVGVDPARIRKLVERSVGAMVKFCPRCFYHSETQEFSEITADSGVVMDILYSSFEKNCSDFTNETILNKLRKNLKI